MSKSVAKNALYSGIRTVAFMLFPLITYPYATRVLMAENLGKIDFSVSFVSYFLLIAALGINTYATRQGAGIREDRRQLDEFASQVFTINMVSTALAYALLAALVVLWPHLHGYLALIAIQSLTILGTTIGVEWVYSLEEDYGYITARTILVQLVSTVLLFALVHDPSDYVVYAAITVFSGVGGNVFNWMRARRYTRIRLVWNFDYKRHLAPMLILFGNAIAVTIYVNIDVSLLSVMRGDYEVGIYGLSVKIYRMVKQLLVAIITVSLPRLSIYVAQNNRDDYLKLLYDMAHGLLIIVSPVLLVLGLMASDVVLIMGGETFLEATSSLRLLCVAGLFSVAGNFFANAVLLPFGGERRLLFSTVIGAVVNFALNLVAIPLAGDTGAAITTAVAEACVFLSAAWYSRQSIDLKELCSRLSPALVTLALGIGAVLLVSIPLAHLPLPWIAGFFVRGLCFVTVYAIVLLLKRDPLLLMALGAVRARIGHDDKD